MTISPLPPGTSTFYGPNGQLLSGGKVFNYIPRSTFNKATWSNPTQASQNANPIVLDSSGSAVVYGFGALRQIVQDSSGQTIWDSPTWGGQNTQTVVVLSIAEGGLFIVPKGVFSLGVECVGGGGAGSNCTSATTNGDVSGGGGGAGGFARTQITVTPGQSISYGVGPGGPIGSQNDGGPSNFGSFVLCNGGKGSSFKSQGTSVGGAGGTASGGTILNITGGAGTDGSHIPTSGGHPYIGNGIGGESFYGRGGTSANGASGNSGQAPGSGGGGTMDVNLTGVFFDGGAGADGQIIISYWS